MASPQERKFAFSYLERGKQFATTKQYPEALEALREAVRRDPALVEAWIMLASVHYALGEDVECLGATEEALKHQANSGGAWIYRGLALARLKHEEEALDAFAQTMRIDGWFVIAAQNTFTAFLNLERYDEALRVADTLLAEQRSNGHFWAMRSAALRYSQRHDEAHQAASGAVRRSPQDGYAWRQLTATLCRSRQYDEALAALERESELDGISSVSWRLKADILTGQRHFEQALAAIKEARALEPESASNWNRGGLALLNLGRPAEAYNQFVKAVTSHTRKPGYPTNAGIALTQLRRYEDALTWTDQALALRPRFVAGVINRAEVLVHLLQYQEAEAQLAEASEVASEHSGYWAVKGTLHKCRGEYDEALMAIKRAIDLSDDDSNTAVAWERMGELLLALEDYEKALEVAGHGLTIRPHDFCLQELKAKALRGLGRESEADEIDRGVQARLAEQLALLDHAQGADE
jgi:tetratricopeptide (TPR) repeat protein